MPTAARLMMVSFTSPTVFAHFSAINYGGFCSLEESQRVEFEVQQGPKGLQAANITVVS